MTAAMLVHGADLRSRPSTGTLRLPSRAKRPTGGGGGGRVAVPRPSGSRRRRPRGLLRSIPHAELLKSVIAPDRPIGACRIWIRMWLDCPVEDTDDRGRRTRTTEARDKRRGAPQGSPISPLLANIYMRRFVLGWKMFGERTWHAARDLRRRPRDPVQKGQSRSGLAETAGDHEQAEAHGERGKDAHLQSAGRRVRLFWDTRSGEYVERGPAKLVSATGRQGKAFSGWSRRSTLDRPIDTWQETTTLVGKVERTLRGWANYFGWALAQGVSGARCLRGDAVARWFALQAQGQGAMGRELSTLHPLRRTSRSYV